MKEVFVGFAQNEGQFSVNFGMITGRGCSKQFALVIPELSPVLIGPFPPSHRKTLVKGRIYFFERRGRGGGAGLLGNFRKNFLNSKNC